MEIKPPCPDCGNEYPLIRTIIYECRRCGQLWDVSEVKRENGTGVSIETATGSDAKQGGIPNKDPRCAENAEGV